MKWRIDNVSTFLTIEIEAYYSTNIKYCEAKISLKLGWFSQKDLEVMRLLLRSKEWTLELQRLVNLFELKQCENFEASLKKFKRVLWIEEIQLRYKYESINNSLTWSFNWKCLFGQKDNQSMQLPYTI